MADHPRMEHQYHSLPAVTTEEEVDNAGDIVWDQLNDEQSREVQQHESRFHNGDRYGRENPFSIAWSMAQQTANTAGHAVRQTAEKAKVTVLEWQQNKQNHGFNNYYDRSKSRSISNANANDNNDEFDLRLGIQDLLRRGGESSLSLDAAADNHTYASSNRAAIHGNETVSTEQQDKKLEQQPLKGYPFVILKEGRDVPSRNDYNMQNTNERDRWGIVGNLDIFLTHLYKYYYYRGLTPMLCSFLVEITCLLFTIWLTRLLLIGVNWPKLLTMNCDEENNNVYDDEQENNNNTCHSHLSDYARTDPLGWTPFLLIQGYTFLLLIYAFFKSWVFYQDFFGYAIQCRTILHDKLGLSERKLQGGALSWNDVVTKLAEGQESGTYKIIQNQPVNHFDTHNINGNGYSPLQNISDDIEEHRYLDGESQSKLFATAPISNGRTDHPPTAPPAAAFDLPANPSRLQQNHHHKQTLLDPLQIAQRIMRKENFLLAFWNAGLLDCTKIVFPWSGGSDGTQRHYWCGVLEWSFYQCVLNFMFNHKYELRPAFCLDSDSLKRRLKVCGIVHLCLLPFLLVFVVLHFFLRHVYDSKISSDDGNGGGGMMGHQRWSSAAVWQFREFNELPHAFEKRMEPSYSAASQYCKLFGTSEYLAALGRLLVFFGGAIGGILFVLGVIVNDALLLHVQLWGRNLVWYAGMAGITYSVGKALEPTKEATPSVSKNIFEDMDTALKKVSQYTHYYPEHWKGRGWDAKVHNSFKTLFDSEIKLFLYELSALVLTPYILYFRLSEKSSDICEFCLVSKTKLVLASNISTNIGGGSSIVAGDVCGFSTFDFDRFGDEEWEGKTLGKSAILQRQRENGAGGPIRESLTESILRTGNLEDATRLHPKPRARYGKMEKSFLTFKEAHPDWAPSFPPGKSPVNQFEECRRDREQAMIERERNLHVQAATRQLETLEELKQQKSQNRNQHPMGITSNIHWNNDHHAVVARKNPTADAAAGRQNGSPPPSLSSDSNLTRSQKQHQSSSQPRSMRKPSPPKQVSSTVKNALRPFAESLTPRTENIPSFPSSLVEDSATGNSSPEISLPFSPHIPVSSVNQKIPTLHHESGDNLNHHQKSRSPIPPVNASTSISLRYESESDGSDSSQKIAQQRKSSTRSDLTFSSPKLASSLKQDVRGSQNENHWLERFHEHLEKQQEEVQHHQQQQRCDLQTNVSFAEEKNNFGDGSGPTTLKSWDPKTTLTDLRPESKYIPQIGSGPSQRRTNASQMEDDYTSSG